MMEEKKQRGGRREGAGRHTTGRNVTLSVRILPDTLDKLNELTHNKSEYIDALICKAYEAREAGE